MHVDDDFEKVLLACLAKKPADRPNSALALQRQLETCVDCQTWVSPMDAVGAQLEAG